MLYGYLRSYGIRHVASRFLEHFWITYDVNGIVSRHVESIALLERVSNRKADAKVRIDVDLEDYYQIKDAKR